MGDEKRAFVVGLSNVISAVFCFFFFFFFFFSLAIILLQLLS